MLTSVHACQNNAKGERGGSESSGGTPGSGGDGPASASEWHDVARDGFVGTVGKTPLIRLRGPSEETGCEILAKVQTHLLTRTNELMRCVHGMINDALL